MYDFDDWLNGTDKKNLQDDIDQIHDFLDNMFEEEKEEGESDTDEFKKGGLLGSSDSETDIHDIESNTTPKHKQKPAPHHTRNFKKLLEEVYGSYGLKIIKLYITMAQNKIPHMENHLIPLVSSEVEKLLEVSTNVLQQIVKLRKNTQKVSGMIATDKDLKNHLININYLLGLYPIKEKKKNEKPARRETIEILLELKSEFREILDSLHRKRRIPQNDVNELITILIDELQNVFEVFEDKNAQKRLEKHYKKFSYHKDNFMEDSKLYVARKAHFDTVENDFLDIKRCLAGFRDIVYHHTEYKRNLLGEHFDSDDQIDPEEEKFFFWSKFQAGTLKKNKNNNTAVFSNKFSSKKDPITLQSAIKYIDQSKEVIYIFFFNFN